MKRTLLWMAYAVYLVAVAYLVWDPDPTVPSATVWRVSHLLERAHVPVSPASVEFGLNVLLFVPMSLLGSFLIPRLRVTEWVTIGFVASLAVELVQRTFLTSRTADPKDVVSNTLGALIGALLAWILRWLVSRRASGPPQPTATVVEERAKRSAAVEERAKRASRHHRPGEVTR